MRIAIENAMVWDGATTVEPSTLHIADGGILSVDKRPAGEGEERIDASDRLAIPGLVNAHTHLYSALSRGMLVPGFAPRSFADILEGLWWRLDRALDPAAVQASAIVGAIDAVRCGVTTVIDHHASPNAISGSLGGIRDAVCHRVGVRALLSYEVSDRDGPSTAREGIRENETFAAEAAGIPALLGAHFGLHASFTLSDATLDAVAAHLPDGVGVHVHVAEGVEDEELTVRRHGLRIAERLDRFGLLRPQSIVAHTLHVDDSERELLAERDVAIVHNPRSNMNNAVGTFDLPSAMRHGLFVGLGTDGIGANMLSELFAASLLQKHVQTTPTAAPFSDLYELLFAANPRIAERTLGYPLGSLSAGYPADIVLLDYLPPTPLRGDNILGHLLFGPSVGALRVSDVYVAGRAILRNGSFVELDEARELARAREEAARLWKRFASGVGR
ncbi:MAG: putative aminohydrolase SsnA [Candidatus Bipolaricaulota bacterium]